MDSAAKSNLAYVIGAALGDGNLSNPNGRAVRLRITCDTKYPKITEEIATAVKTLLPDNKVSLVPRTRDNCLDVSVYSNKLAEYLPWKTGFGSKFDQNACVPKWITRNKKYSIACLKGLIQTDGSIYYDRGYKMINFTNNISALSKDVQRMLDNLGYKAQVYTAQQKSGRPKYTVRLSKKVDEFLHLSGIQKN